MINGVSGHPGNFILGLVDYYFSELISSPAESALGVMRDGREK